MPNKETFSLSIDEMLNSLSQEMQDMEKSASENTDPTEIQVDDSLEALLCKSAADHTTAASEGRRIAEDIMTKLANEIQEQAAINSASNVPTPTVIGDPSEQTVDDVFAGLIQKALASGAVPADNVERLEQTEEQMKKEAQEMGQNLANAILTKMAEDAGLVPVEGTNLINLQNAQMAAEREASVTPTPEGDVNAILAAMVQKGIATGGNDPANPNPVQIGPTAQAVNAEAQAAAVEDEVEKAAAMLNLMDQGFGFDEAVSLVKVAEHELYAEAYEQEKIAYVNALMDEGYDVESAVALVKEAADYSDVYAADQKAAFRSAAEGLGGLVGGGLAGAGIGAGISALAGKGGAVGAKIGGIGGSLLGSLAGGIHGGLASIRNSLNKHEQYGGGEGTHTLGDAFGANARSAGRSLLQGVGGGLAGGALGTGLGAGIAALAKKDRLAGALIGGGAGALLGNLGGGIHGHYASMRNSLNKAEARGASQVKQAAEAPLLIGHDGMGTKAKDWIGKNKKALGIAAGGLAAAGLAAAAFKKRNQEKTAAVNALVDQGVDFETAALLVQETSQELYGE